MYSRRAASPLPGGIFCAAVWSRPRARGRRGRPASCVQSRGGDRAGRMGVGKRVDKHWLSGLCARPGRPQYWHHYRGAGGASGHLTAPCGHLSDGARPLVSAPLCAEYTTPSGRSPLVSRATPLSAETNTDPLRVTSGQPRNTTVRRDKHRPLRVTSGQPSDTTVCRDKDRPLRVTSGQPRDTTVCRDKHRPPESHLWSAERHHCPSRQTQTP